MPFKTESDVAGRTAAHLSRRSQAALAAGVALMLLAGVAAGFLAFRTAVADRWVSHTLAVREGARELTTLSLQMQGSVRGYLLTGDASFLGPYAAASNALPPAFDRLERLAADNPGQLDLLAAVRSNVTVLTDRYGAMLALAAAGNAAAAIDQVRSHGGEEAMQAVRQAIDVFSDEELALLVKRQAAADRLRRWTLLLVVGALVSTSLLAASLWRWMLHYVNRLVLQSAELAEETRRRRESEATLVQAQKMEAVGQLAGGIAHDFNNMLTIILGNLSTALRRLGKQGPVPADVAKPLEAAEKGARGAAQLTHRLLAFSRRQPLAPSQLDLNRVVSGVTDLIRRTIGEDIELETVLSAGLWPTFADAHQLENAIVNLVVNARDAMPDGGRITIETANGFLDEAYAAGFGDVAPGQYVMLCVSDTGHGVPAELIGRVFEPFFTTKPEGQGSGLGLAMVHGFVKQSGGHIRLYSEVGQGTTVKVYLPRLVGAERTPSAPAVAADGDATPSVGGSETILVVEDNEGVRTYARDALTEAGYAVVEATNAAEAMAVMTDGHAVDLLFTDVVLGRGPNGRQLADGLAARGITVPVLFTTGYSRNAIVHNGRLDPGVDLLEKPYTQRELTRRVRLVLDRRTARGAEAGTAVAQPMRSDE